MTDSTLQASAGRLASFLDRQYCAWMPSPSVALLAALVTGKGRPKRLLLTEGAPAFISNLGRITGATAMTVSQEGIDETLKVLLRTEGLSAENIWAVATHREGKLSPTDWLSRCDARGIPTIELCLGSLWALARWTPFPATFTIVDLDAEKAFAGVRLAALLTNDRKGASRIHQLCLPAAGTPDYILDASPRGLMNDEAALARLVDEVIALEGEMPEGARRFDSAGNAVSRELSSRIEEQQRVIDGWEARFTESEAEAAQDAALLSRARADLLKEKTESANLLASMRAEQESLARKLLRAERERDLTVADAARRDESERGLQRELRRRVEEFEKASGAFAERESRLAAAAEASRAQLTATAEASRAQLSARIARLEADAVTRDAAGADLLEKKEEVERSLASMLTQKDALTRKLSDLDAELSEALAEASEGATGHRAALEEQRQRASKLQEEITALTAREADRARESEVSRAAGAERIKGLEAETTALAARLAKVEKDRGLALAEASRREEAERARAAEQGRRVEQLETEIAASKKREARLGAEWATARSGLSEQVARLEADAVRAEKTFDEFRKEKATAQAALEQARAALEKAQSEGRAAMDRATAAEAAHQLARNEAARNEEALKASLTEKITGLEAMQGADDRAMAALRTRMEEAENARARLEVEKEGLSLTLADLESEHARAVAEVGKRGDEETAQAWEAERARMSERIARLDEQTAEAEKANRALVEASARRLAEVEKSLEEKGRLAAQLEEGGAVLRNREKQLAEESAIARSENEALRSKIVELEKEHEIAHAEREAKLNREWEASKAELVERLRRAEDAAVVARNANVGLQTRKTEAEQARASLQSELEEQMRLAQQLKMEAASVAAREAKKVEAAEASRAELEARLVKREAAEALADKARTELLNRKRESDQALAAVQAERAGLLKKIAALERERDQARPATVARPPLQEPSPPAAASPGEAPEVAGEHNTGGLSGLLDLWNTAVIRRPARIKEKEPKPAEPDVLEVFEVDSILNEPKAPTAPPPPPAAAPAKPAEKAKEHRTTGGLSALVNLWTTAATMRPFRRKEKEAKLELIPDDSPPPGKERPGKTARPRPASPSRPDPKPAAPDETEKLGGWLRGLAGRMRGKSK